MRTHILFHRATAFGAVSLIAVAATSMLSLNAMADGTESIETLETIIVTGEKIDKDINDTTNAITVIGEEVYASGEVKEVNELVKSIPNVTNGGFGTVNIRGVNGSGPAIGSNAFMTNGNPRVATIVDGLSEAWGGYNFNPAYLWDVKQVEVMRGPQSTNQGEHSIGGAIVLQTNDPSQEWEAAVRGGIESYDNGNTGYNQAVMASGPLIKDELAFRIAVDHTNGESWVSYHAVDDELDGAPDLEDTESLTLRGKLLWTPSNMPKLKTMLTVIHRNNEGAYLNWVDLDSNDTLTLDDEEGTNTRIQDSSVDSIALDVTYEFTPALTNHTQLSYNDYSASFEEYPGDTLLTIKDSKTTFENRLVYTPADSKLSGFVGIYAAQSDSTLDVNFGSSFDAYDGDTTKTSSSVFGEVSYAMSAKWALTTGARIQHEEQERYLDVYDNIMDEELDETVFLPKLEVIYSPSNANSIGASVRKGYNPGGDGLSWWNPDGGSWEYYTFDAETVIAYELSSKNRFSNGSMLNANLFFNDYSDYQAYTDYILENVESAYTYGAELEALAFPTNTLELRGSLGMLKSKVSSTDEDDWKDNELPFTANFNLSAGFTQYIGENWSIGADTTYVSEYYSDLENTDNKTAGDYFTVDARLQYLWGDFTIDAYVTNLTNEKVVYQTQASEYAAGKSRTIGISASYKM